MAAVPATVPAPAGQLRFDRPSQLKAAAIAAAFVALFWELLDFVPPHLGQLVHAWVFEPDWTHGPLIPLFSAYLIYKKWDDVRACPIRLAWLGLPVLLAGFLLYLWALTGLLTFGYARPVALMVTLLGVLILLCGLPALRHLWLPWLYLFFAVPIPQRIYFALTDPLRRMAATVAATVLDLIPNLDVHRLGSNLEYVYNGASGMIGVADACSGMRSTVTLCAVGVAVAFMSDRPLWQRAILVLSCVPIATFCNFVRVTITCYLYVFVDPKYAGGHYHMMLGLVIVALAFAVFTGLAWALGRVVVEESEPEADQV